MANVNVGFGLKPINVAGSTPVHKAQTHIS